MRARRRYTVAALLAVVAAATSGVLPGAAAATRPARSTRVRPASAVAERGGPIANVCSLLNGQEIGAALGGRYVPIALLNGWAASFGQKSVQEANPLYAINHAYREIASANCGWTRGPRASGEYVDLNYLIGVYAIPVSPSAMLDADAKQAARDKQSAIDYAPVKDLGRWAGFARTSGTSILRVVVGRDIVTMLDSNYSRAAQRAQCIQLARIIVKQLS